MIRESLVMVRDILALTAFMLAFGFIAAILTGVV